MNVAIGIRFQFHKGTIKTYRPSPLMRSYYDFNSIKVRLKLLWYAQFVILTLNFNSIKVRLKQGHDH